MSFGVHPARALERGYGRRIEIALLAAVLIHATAFVVMPPYVARPYRLEATPLRVVAAGGFGVDRASVAAGKETTPGPAVTAAPSAAPRIVTEQLRVASVPAPETGASLAARGTGAAEEGTPGGAAEGAGEGAPPVFYAFDSPPEVLSRAEPDYPLAARLAGAEGLVVLNANVDPRGRVMRVWVARSTAPEALVESAIDAMYRFRFTPGSQQGIPVPCTVAVPFDFRLNLRIESSGGNHER